ncbi:MAG TPA: IPT/TIG domain-containing protein, partial [Symbiobacteriaceae bacterium]|nr:IPT/TIG domain-containing protein [Symbiobacteriaceae bacterium]
MRLRVLCSALAMALLFSVLAPGFAPRPARAGALLTVGAFLVTAKITQSLIGDVIDDVEQSVKVILQEFHDQVGSLIGQVEASYGSALDTTLDSLDQFTATQLSRLGSLLDDVNQKLLAGISAAEQAVLNIIREANQTIGQALSQMEDLIVVGIRGATYVIDKTTYNALFFAAIVFLAIGLLFFIGRVWKGLPQGRAPRTIALLFMAAYLGLFGALLLPTVRAYAITMVGQADQLAEIGSGPRIFTVTPSKVNTSPEMQITLTGANFDAGGAPAITVAGQAVTPAAWGDSFALLKLTGSVFTSLKGQQPINLTTKEEKTVSTLVEFVQPPPPPQINTYRMVPTGKGEEFKLFGPVYLECTKAKGRVDATVLVGEGYTLAIDDAHIGQVVPSSQFRGTYPNPARGYSEARISFD